MGEKILSKSKLGSVKNTSFSSLLRMAQQGELSSSLYGSTSFEHSFIKNEERKLNLRKYKEEMKKNRVKVKIREK